MKNRNKTQVQTLIDLKSKANAFHSIFVKELGFAIRLLDIEVQGIDSTILNTFRIVVTVFSMTDKINWVKFFEKIFLLAHIN